MSRAISYTFMHIYGYLVIYTQQQQKNRSVNSRIQVQLQYPEIPFICKYSKSFCAMHILKQNKNKLAFDPVKWIIEMLSAAFFYFVMWIKNSLPRIQVTAVSLFRWFSFHPKIFLKLKKIGKRGWGFVDSNLNKNDENKCCWYPVRLAVIQLPTMVIIIYRFHTHKPVSERAHVWII